MNAQATFKQPTKQPSFKKHPLLPSAIDMFDWTLFLSIVALVSVGTLMIFSTSSVVGLANYGDGYFYLKRHLLFLVVGVFAFLTGLILPKSIYRKYLGIGYVISVGFVLLTLIPGVGLSLGGANRWLSLGFMQFQPVEIVKFVMIVFAASYLDWKREKLTIGLPGLVPLLGVLGLPLILLILQPDLSNIILISFTLFVLLFLSKVPGKTLLFLVVLGLVSVSISIFTHPYQMERVQTFLSPETDIQGKGYHIHQSLMAISSGGEFGLGIGQSKLKFFYLPLHYSDFIYSIVCEEGGFLAGSLVILLFALFLKRAFVRAKESPSDYDYFLIIGLAVLIVFQMAINIGATMAVFPVTGIPLTFISFGGTSLVMSLFFVGVILSPKTVSNSSPNKVSKPSGITGLESTGSKKGDLR